jgi:hypothetical protein
VPDPVGTTRQGRKSLSEQGTNLLGDFHIFAAARMAGWCS